MPTHHGLFQRTILLTGANGGLCSAVVSNIVSTPELAAYHGIYTARNVMSARSLDAALKQTQVRPPHVPHSSKKVSLDLSRLSNVRTVAADINPRELACYIRREHSNPGHSSQSRDGGACDANLDGGGWTGRDLCYQLRWPLALNSVGIGKHGPREGYGNLDK